MGRFIAKHMTFGTFQTAIFFLERVNISLNPDFVSTAFLPKLWRDCQAAGSLVGLEAAVVL